MQQQVKRNLLCNAVSHPADIKGLESSITFLIQEKVNFQLNILYSAILF
jgi:hypothetical protein